MTIPWPNARFVIFPDPAHNGKAPVVHIKSPEYRSPARGYRLNVLFNSGGGLVLCKSDPADLSRYPNRTQRYGAPVEYATLPAGAKLCRHCKAALVEYLRFCEAPLMEYLRFYEDE